MRRRILHQAIGSLIRTSSQPATRTTSCTLATLFKTKRSEASLSPSPAQGMHTSIRMHKYTICHSSLARYGQSICRTHIQPTHAFIYPSVCIRIYAGSDTSASLRPRMPKSRPVCLPLAAAAACHRPTQCSRPLFAFSPPIRPQSPYTR